MSSHHSIAEAAALLGVSPQTVRRRIKRGDLRALLVDGPNGAEYRISADELTRQAEEQANQVTSHGLPLTMPETMQQPRQESTQAGAGELVRLLGELETERERAAVVEAENARLKAELARQQALAEERGRQEAARQADVDFLRAELERRGKAEEELRVLMLRTTQALETAQQRALPAPGDDPAPKQRPWWRLW